MLTYRAGLPGGGVAAAHAGLDVRVERVVEAADAPVGVGPVEVAAAEAEVLALLGGADVVPVHHGLLDLPHRAGGAAAAVGASQAWSRREGMETKRKIKVHIHFFPKSILLHQALVHSIHDIYPMTAAKPRQIIKVEAAISVYYSTT